MNLTEAPILPAATETSPEAESSGRAQWRAVESEFAAGLRNYWYALIPSTDVGARPVALKRLGEDLMLWRDGEGKPRLFPDACAHRGARLSLGYVEGGTLHCCYHGWAYDGSGQCVAIPSQGGACKMATEVKVRSYPVEEFGGMIFGYLSDVAGAPHKPSPQPEQMGSPEWNGFIISHYWEGVNWFRVLENLVDPIHAPFLHARTYTMGHGVLEDTVTVEDRPDGLFVARAGQKLISFDYSDYHFPNWCQVDVPYPWSAGPGGDMSVTVFVTPMDKETTQVYMVRKRRITGWKWWIWWTLWQLRLRRKMWEVIVDDEAVLASQGGGRALNNEYLAQSDVGIMRMRRLFTDEWKKRRGAA